VSLRLIASARPRVHHDALDWARRVAANGGSVSQSTLRSVSAFCDAIDRAAIRDRFYRLNLFCGTGLSACLVPLYRGPTFSGTQYGGTTDTNTGPFVSGDYAETGASGGLDGDGNLKYLNTGLTYDAMGTPATMHLAAFKSSGTWTQQRELIGARDSDDLYQIQFRYPSSQYKVSAYAGGSASLISEVSVSTDTSFLVLSRNSSTSLVLYENASSIGSNATSTTPGGANHNILVFNRNAIGTPQASPWAHRIMGYSIGLGLSSTQVTDYNAAMQKFQTALSRNV